MLLFYYLVLFATMPRHRLVETELFGLTLVKWVGALCFVYAFIRIATAKVAPNLVGSWQLRFSYLLFFFSALSWALHSSASGILFSPITAYISFALLLFIASVVVDNPNRLRRVVLLCLASTALASVYVLREFQKAGFQGRPGWIAGDSNYFGICAVLVIPVAFYLVRSGGGIWERRISLATLGLVLPAFTVTSSRGAFMGLCVAASYGALRSRNGLKDLILLSIALIPLLVFLPSSPIERFLHPVRGDTEAVDIRETLWKAGLQMFEAHPIFGVGVGQFSSSIDEALADDLRHRYIAHNTYLEYAAEMGVVGLGLYGAVLVSCIYGFSRLRRLAALVKDRFWFSVALGSECGILGYAVAAFFLSAEYQKLFWVFVSLSAIAPAVVGRAMRAKARSGSGLCVDLEGGSALSTLAHAGKSPEECNSKTFRLLQSSGRLA